MMQKYKSLASYFLLLSALLCLPTSAHAESERIAIIKSRQLAPYAEAVKGITQSLNKQKVTAKIDLYELEGDLEKGEELAAEISKNDSRLIFAIGSEAIQTTLKHTSQIPIITSMVYDPMGQGLIPADQQDRVYGSPLTVSWEQRFQILKEVLPEWNRLSIIYRPNEGDHLILGAQTAAEKAGVELILLPMESLSGFLDIVQQAQKESQALIMILDRKIYNKATAKELFLYSARRKFPVVAYSPNYTAHGALLSLSVEFEQNGLDAGKIGIRLLNQETLPEHFPQATSIWVTWNKGVAKAHGIKLSSTARKKINAFI